MNSAEILYIFQRLNGLENEPESSIKAQAIQYFKDCIIARCCGSCRFYEATAVDVQFLFEACLEGGDSRPTERDKVCEGWRPLNDQERS